MFFVMLWIFGIVVVFDGARHIDDKVRSVNDEPDADRIWRIIEFCLGSIIALAGNISVCICITISMKLSTLLAVILGIVFTLFGIVLSFCIIAIMVFMLSCFNLTPRKKAGTPA
ncbi:MAG: hypothetical protein WC536_00480 [Patescibacteria group bacterium]